MTARKPGPPPSKCTRCGAQVQWWINANRVERSVAVNPSWNNSKGTVQQIVSGTKEDPKVYAKVLNEREVAAAVADGEKLFVLHSTDCSANKPFNPMPNHVRASLSTMARPDRRRTR